MKILAKILTTAALCGILTYTALAEPVNMVLNYDGQSHNYYAESIVLKVNGQPVDLPLMPPVILNSRTYVPSREIFEPLGALVEWKQDTKEVFIAHDGHLVIIKPDSMTADVNGEQVQMENPAKIINDKMMIPLRFASESLMIPIEWDGDSRTVSVGFDDSHESLPAFNEEDNTLPSIYDPIEEIPDWLAPQPDTNGQNGVSPAPSVNSYMSVDVSTEPLTEIDAENEVSVTRVTANGNRFIIETNGVISKAEKMLLDDNKLVLDIYNAENKLSSPTLTYTGFGGVTAVRNSQFQTEPENITRVVFDLWGDNRFSVSFSLNRNQIFVDFEANTVYDPAFTLADSSESVTISTSIPVQIIPSRMFSPERIVVDIPNARNDFSFTEFDTGGSLITKIRASQFDAGTARIVLDIADNVSYSTVSNGADTVITVVPAAVKNISYSPNPSTVKITGAGHDITAGSIKHNDDYFNFRHTLTLNANYSEYFGSDSYEINDGVVKSLVIQTGASGNTEIIINTDGIRALTIAHEGADIVIKVLTPKEVYKTIVYIDPGHGGAHPGAVYGGYMEKNLNLNIGLKLYALLENDPDIKVYASRLDDSRPENGDRARTANAIADLFLSIHLNSAESAASGTEVLYKNHEGEVYPKISSEAAARIAQTHLVRALGTKDRGVVKRTNLEVLNVTTIPAILCEIAFMTNSADLAKVSTEEGRQKAADALYSAVKEIFAQYPTGR